MPGPAPHEQPTFPAECLDQCRSLVRRRTVARSQYQRARLAFLLHESPASSNVAAGAVVEMHANSCLDDYFLHMQTTKVRAFRSQQ